MSVRPMKTFNTRHSLALKKQSAALVHFNALAGHNGHEKTIKFIKIITNRVSLIFQTIYQCPCFTFPNLYYSQTS